MVTDSSILLLYFFIILGVLGFSCSLGIGTYFIFKCCKKRRKDGAFLDSDDEDEKAERELEKYNASIRDGIEMEDMKANKLKKKKRVTKLDGNRMKVGSRIMGSQIEEEEKNNKFGNTRDRDELFFESQKKEAAGSRFDQAAPTRSRLVKRSKIEREPAGPTSEMLFDDPMAPESRLPVNRSNLTDPSSSDIIITPDGRRLRKVKKVIKKVVKKKSRQDES